MLEFLTQSTWVVRLGWVLVHSLWQFALVALLMVLLQRTLLRRSATTRYGAFLAGMFIMVVMPVTTWFSPWCADSPTVAVKLDARENPEKASPLQHAGDMMPMVALHTEPPVGFGERPQIESLDLEPAPIGLASPWSVVKRHVQPWLAEIVLVWFAGVLLVAIRPLLSWYTVRRLKRVGVSPLGGPVHDVLERTAEKLRLTRAVEVLQSTLVKTPVVIGCFRPLVLLPLCVVTGLPVAQLEMILAHELAHIRRHDYLVNLIQTLVETLFFYHPAVWWLSRQIRNERENCCDDIAIATVGSRADYGRALLAIKELRATSPSLSLAASDGSLLARIRRIAGCEPTPRVVGGGSILGVILVSLAVFAAVTWGAAPAEDKSVANDQPGKLSMKKAENQIIFAGLCHDDQGRPIAGAEVFLYRSDIMESLTQKQLQTVRTGRDGEFRFAAVADLTKDQDDWKRLLPQYAPYRIIAKASGRATASKCVPLPSVDPRHVDLRMPEGAILSGKVTGPDGKPVKGALVSWFGIPEPIPGVGSAITDGAGRFEIRDMWKTDQTEQPKGRGAYSSYSSAVSLYVRCPGFGDKRVDSKVPGTVDVKLELAAIIEGRVVFGDDGKPAASVPVQFQSIKEHAFRRVITDATGRYRFGSLGPDKYNIWASKDGYTMRAIDSFETVPGTTKTAPDLRLVRGGLIVGHVVDSDSRRPFCPSDATAPPWFRPDVAMYGPSRPRSGAACEAAPIQKDGSFKIRAAPGSNYVYLRIYTPSEAVPPAAMDVDVAEGQTVTVDFKVRKRPATETAPSNQQPKTRPATGSSSGAENPLSAPKATSPFGKTSAANHAAEASPASDQSATKEGAKTDSKPAPAPGLTTDPNAGEARAIRGRAQILARVGNDVVLTSDVLIGIDDMMANARIRIPPDKVAKQWAALVQEVTAGIDAFNAHYLDPDPVKAMSLSQRRLIHQLVRQQIDAKMIYQDFRKMVPKEALPPIEESVNRHFEENQLKILMKRENVGSRADLENALRAKGSSLEREKRTFMERILAQQWVQEQVRVKENIENEPFENRYKEWLEKLHAKYPVWTVFDNTVQEVSPASDQSATKEAAEARNKAAKAKAENDINIQNAIVRAAIAKAFYEARKKANDDVPGAIPKIRLNDLSLKYKEADLAVEKARRDQRIAAEAAKVAKAEFEAARLPDDSKARRELEMAKAEAKYNEAIAKAQDEIDVRYATAVAETAKAEYLVNKKASEDVPGSVPKKRLNELSLKCKEAYVAVEKAWDDQLIAAEAANVAKAEFEKAKRKAADLR